jgi:lipoyl(octanoyl) transferase
VEGIERAIVATVAQWGIAAAGRRDAPGVYVGARKLASVGLRIRRGCSYHGLALNVAMDLEPFRRINPCGYAGLEMTQLSELGGPAELGAVAEALAPRLLAELGLDAAAQSATSTWRQEVSSV